MSDQASPHFYQNANNKAKSTYVQGWRPSDWWVFAITTLGTAAGWLAVNNDQLHWGWALLITLSLGFNVHIEYARLHRELKQLLEGGYIAVFLRDILWESEPTGNRLVRYLRERRYRLREDRRAPIPLSLQFVEATVDDIRERYGVVDELDSDTGYMGVLCEGSAYGELDFSEQQRVHADMSRALNAFFGTSDRRVGVTELRMERPADLTVIDRMFARSGDPFMYYPDGLPADIDPQERRFDLDEGRQRWADFRSEAYRQLKPSLRKVSATRNWQVLMISFKWKGVADSARGGKLDDQQLSDQPLIELGRTLNQEIAMIPGLELQNPHVMGPIELSEFIRCALIPDEVATEQYYHDKAIGKIVSNEDELEVVTAEMVREHPDQYTKSDIGTILSDLRTWPQKRIVVKSDRILIDDTWFMVVRFTQTPEVEHPSKAQQVHFAVPAGQWSTHAEVSERTSGTIDTNMLMSKETAKRSWEEHRSKRKMIVNPKYRRRQRLADVGIEQVSASSTNQRYLPVTVLTAPREKPRLLNKRFKAYRVVMKGQGIKIAKVKGRARMLLALITGALGINRL